MSPAAADLNRAAALASPGAAVMSVQHLAALGEIDLAFDVARGFLLQSGPAVGALRQPAGATAASRQFMRKTMMLFIPPTAPMRADPRFLSMAEEMGMADYWAKAGRTPDFLQ
ncbi:hypothetical protein [Sandaracinobacteroides hominis]|uniref:hypothetical protein n=1 Tax=Sandaracinobacteroides hominis TaxID=2780086 RepID=UPI0018F55052|nr:hypothetical protein [Sandaracinobacteroides hominis]